MTAITKTLFATAFILLSITVWSQGVTLPRNPSPAGSVSQVVGISRVTVNYSRPSVKNREVWGALVPYGWTKQSFGTGNIAPWRAGANENTFITLSNDATIEGHKVPAGSYGLFFVINKDNSGEVILSKDYKSWGSFFYSEDRDEMRAKIQTRDAPMTEMLTYDFNNSTKTSSDLVMSWEKKQFPVKIEFDVDDIVMKNAEAELKGATGFGPQGFTSAANYAMVNKVNTDEALAWIEKANAQGKSYTSLNIKAGLLRTAGKNAEADAAMKEAVTLATENELNAYGYTLLSEGEKAKALSVFILNTQRNPKSANTWDSLGEGYVLNGDTKNAITSFKKSLSLNPPEPTKLNSEKFLKQLGAM